MIIVIIHQGRQAGKLRHEGECMIEDGSAAAAAVMYVTR